jgi:hypothetical protein
MLSLSFISAAVKHVPVILEKCTAIGRFLGKCRRRRPDVKET